MADQFQATICNNSNWWSSERSSNNTINGSFETISCSTDQLTSTFSWPSSAGTNVFESKSLRSCVESPAGSVSNSSSVALHDQIPVYSSDPMLDFSNLLSPTMSWSQTFLSGGYQVSENNINALLQEDAMISTRYDCQQIPVTEPNELLQNNFMGNSLHQDILRNDRFRRNTGYQNSEGLLPSEDLSNGLQSTGNQEQLQRFYAANQAQSNSHVMRSNAANMSAQSVKALSPKHQLQFSNQTTFWSPLSSSIHNSLPNQLFQSNISPYTTNPSPKFDLGVKESDQTSDKKIESEPQLKKPRIQTPSPLPTFKVRKEKLGDRITALQQLVSPFGKTDTASVLHEATDYIKFLHDQVRALSAPYIRNGHQVEQVKNVDKLKDSEGNKQDLRSRGLCLVPMSSTYPVATQTLPIDHLWTSTFGSSYMYHQTQ